jgi:hypothetical protein
MEKMMIDTFCVAVSAISGGKLQVIPICKPEIDSPFVLLPMYKSLISCVVCCRDEAPSIDDESLGRSKNFPSNALTNAVSVKIVQNPVTKKVCPLVNVQKAIENGP